MPVPAIVPFLPMIGQAIGSGIQAIGDSRAAKRQGQFYENLQRSGEQQAKELSKQREGLYELGPTMRKYMQYAMADPTADMQRQEAMRSSGTAVGALKAGGARAILGGLGRQQQMDASNMAQIAADEYRRKTGAMINVGQQEQSLQSAKRSDITNDLDTARRQAASGFQGVFEADQMRRQVDTNLASGLAELAGQAAGAGLFGDGSGIPKNIGVELNEGDTAFERIMGRSAFPEQTEPEGYSFMGNYSGLNQNNSPFSAGYDFGYNVPQFGSAPNLAAKMYRSRQGEYAKGGKTKGAFNHDTNDMKIVDRNGEPTGMSVTGGEYILNPQQAAAIARQSDIARKLFKKFDREA